MGFLLSPIIADIVMQDLEESILSNLNLSIYYRYINDNLIVMSRINWMNWIYIVIRFNSYHKRINVESDHCLNFVNISLINKDNRIIIDWLRKVTNIGTIFIVFSNYPDCQKIGIIYSLIDRVITVSFFIL